MTFKNLKEYCETQYKKTIEIDKKEQTCPVCGHQTFYLYGEHLDKAKCFHPSCGLHLNLNVINRLVDYRIIVADRASRVFRDYLFSKDNQDRFLQPYLYVTEKRKIKDEILRRSDVGAVPLDYNVEKENQDLVVELTEQIEKAEDEEKVCLENKLIELKKFISNFQNKINNAYNWFVSIYRDEKGLITQIKARRPYERNFVVLAKVQEKSGVFNFNLFSSDEISSKKNKKVNKRILIFEGEFDQLSYATWAMDNVFPIQSCALGGANGDIKTALNLTNEKACIVYDNDDAGKELLNRAKRLKSVYELTTPEPYKDIDEYINSFNDCEKCKKEILNLLFGMKLSLRDFKGIKNEITDIMKFSGVHNLEKCQQISLIVIYEILQRGKFFKDNNFAYIFLDDYKQMIPIIPTNGEFKRLLNRMGINAAKDYYNYVVNELSAYAFDNGIQIEIHNFCYYNRKTNALYVFNNKNIVYKITQDNIEIVENGDDGIMFNYNPENEPFELVEIDKSINYFEKYISDSINIDKNFSSLTEKEIKTILWIWFLATFFHSIMPSKVIMVAVGQRGSRKTSIFKRIGIALNGKNYNVTALQNKPEDFDTFVTNNHLSILDNVDTGKSWLNDKLASVATGQMIEKRKLYTDNECVKLPTRTFLAVTSRTPKFTRDDVADRLVFIPLTRKEGFLTENEVISDVIDHRNKIMSFVLFELQKVLNALESTKDKKYKTKFRIADFAVFGLRIFDSIGKKEEFETILDKICETQKEFAVEEDSLVYALKILAKKQIKPHKMSGFELYKNLLIIANEDNFDIPEFRQKYKNVISLTRRISNIASNISNDVKVTIYKERANKKSYKVELVDKEFELPLTNDSLFDRAMDKAQNIESIDRGGKNE